jgi:anaerobic selenocysteine-containing dehydrogenase
MTADFENCPFITELPDDQRREMTDTIIQAVDAALIYHLGMEKDDRRFTTIRAATLLVVIGICSARMGGLASMIAVLDESRRLIAAGATIEIGDRNKDKRGGAS